MWKAIERYAEQNFDVFYFGRTDKNNTGLRQFKMGWNPQENEMNYYRYNLLDDTFEENSALSNTISEFFIKKMPISLLKILGNSIYKHFG